MNLSEWIKENPDKLNVVSSGKAPVPQDLIDRVNRGSITYNPPKAVNPVVPTIPTVPTFQNTQTPVLDSVKLKAQIDTAKKAYDDSMKVLTGAEAIRINPRSVTPNSSPVTLTGANSVQNASQVARVASQTTSELLPKYDEARYIETNDEVKNKADFAQKSQYKSTANGKNIAINPFTGRISETGFDDILYEYINGNPTAKKIYEDNKYGETLADRAGVKLTQVKYMNDEDKAVYNYLYNTQGKEAATDYIKKLDAYKLSGMERQEITDEYKKQAEEHPVLSSVYSVLTSPAKGASYIGQAIDYATDGEINQNARYNRFAYIPTAIRSEVSDIAEKKWGKKGSFLYQTGMSMADFLFNTAITGGLAGGASGISKASEALTLGIMGSGVAADTVIEAKDKGLSDNQAFALGTIAGLAEVATEKVSIETLLNGGWNKARLGYIIKNIVAEGSEEVASDAINLMADVLIAKDQSEWRQDINSYMDNGQTEQQAFMSAFTDQLKKMGMSFLGGALSGGVMAGGAVIGSDVSTKTTYNPFILDIVNEALEINPNNYYAQKIKEKVDAGKYVSGAEIRNLINQNEDAMKVLKPTNPFATPITRTTADEMRLQNSVTDRMGERVIAPTLPTTQTEVRTAPTQTSDNFVFAMTSTPTVQTEATPSVGAEALGNQRWSHAELESGIYENPTNAVRMADMPLKIGDKEVSRMVSTAKGAAITPDDFVPLLEAETMKGKNGFTFDRLKNADVLAAAEKDIMYDGWDASLAKWMNDVTNGRISPKAEAIGQLLYNHAVNSDDYKTAVEILSSLSISTRTAARTLQYASMFRKLSPQTQLYGIVSSVEKLADKMKLGFTPTFSQEAQEAYLTAKTDAEKDIAIDKLAEELQVQLPSASLWEQFRNLRYMNMLGNFKTQIRNLAGNTVMLGMTRAKDTIAYNLEKMLPADQRTKAMLNTRNEADRALIDVAREQFKTDEAVSLGEAKYMDDFSGINTQGDAGKILKKAREGVRRFGFNTPQTTAQKVTNVATLPMEKWSRATSWAMEKGDIIFNRPAYIHAFASFLKAQNITAEQWKSSEWQAEHSDLAFKARSYAIKEAQEATFRDNNRFADFVSKIGKNNKLTGIGKTAVDIISEGILPFRKTPANVAVRAEEYSPLGFINAAVMQAQKTAYDKAVANGQITENNSTASAFAESGANISGADIINQLSKSITGTGVFILGFLLKSMGVLNGAEDEDKNQKYFDDLNGYQPFSINLPNGYSYTLDWLTPDSIPLFMGVQLAQEVENGGLSPDAILDTIMSMSQPMLEMSMISGVRDTFDQIKNGATGGLEQLLLNTSLSFLTQGLTSTLGGQIERIFEPNRMTAYTAGAKGTNKIIQKAISKASAKTLGVDYKQIEYIDAWGRKQSNGDPFANAVTQLFSPGYVSKNTTTKVENELQRIADATGNTAIFPDLAPNNFAVDGETKTLTEEEYVKYAQQKGQTSLKIVQNIINNPTYKALDDYTKADVISKAYQYANAKAKQSISKYEPQSWVQKVDESAKTDKAIADYIVDYVSGNKEKSNKKKEKEDTSIEDLLAKIIANS